MRALHPRGCVLSWGRQGWGLGIPQPFCGCRTGCWSLRVCATVLRSFWSGAWHPLAYAGCRIRCRHVRACSAVLEPSGSGVWHPPTHCWLPPSRLGSRCELRCVFLICWSVVVTCSRMLYGMLWSHCLFLLFLRLLASPVGPCGWCMWCWHGLWWVVRARFLGVSLSVAPLAEFSCVGQSMSDPQLRKFSCFFCMRASALAHVGQLPLG